MAGVGELIAALRMDPRPCLGKVVCNVVLLECGRSRSDDGFVGVGISEWVAVERWRRVAGYARDRPAYSVDLAMDGPQQESVDGCGGGGEDNVYDGGSSEYICCGGDKGVEQGEEAKDGGCESGSGFNVSSVSKQIGEHLRKVLSTARRRVKTKKPTSTRASAFQHTRRWLRLETADSARRTTAAQSTNNRR